MRSGSAGLSAWHCCRQVQDFYIRLSGVPEGLTGITFCCRSGPSFGFVPEWAEGFYRELEEYVQGRRRLLSAPVGPVQGTPFQKRIWTFCSEIPYGEVRTYGQLAHRAGVSRASRAVGQAMARNPLPLLVPCHRVVAAGGRLGGYSGGTDLKRRLLRIEGVDSIVLKETSKSRGVHEP